jgi:serpin B
VVAGESDPGYFDLVSVEDSMAGLGRWLRGLFPSNEEPDRKPSLSHDRSQASGPESFADENNDFALTMYGRLRQRPGNLFFSPFSIRTALSMTQAGARGETAAQIIEALRISSADTPHVAFSDIIHRLKSAGDGKYEMAVANSLWGQDGAPLLPEFLELIRHYDSCIKLVDFRDGAESARREINRWVEDKTRQKIRNLISPGGLDTDTRLVLVNAVYFKGMWVLKFQRTDTRDELFYLEDGGNVRAPLMYQQRDRVRYLQARGYQAVDLIYEGGDLSMLVLLPDRKDGLRDLEKALSAQMLHDCVAKMEIREVKLFLPRFKITWGTVDMRDHLTALGMPLAFTRFKADFSGINGYEPPAEESLFLSAVFHKAFVEVYEEGTEAAAATAVVFGRVGAALYPSKPPPIPIFRADHPFLFAIRDRKTGALLFLGRMADPTPEN